MWSNVRSQQPGVPSPQKGYVQLKSRSTGNPKFSGRTSIPRLTLPAGEAAGRANRPGAATGSAQGASGYRGVKEKGCHWQEEQLQADSPTYQRQQPAEPEATPQRGLSHHGNLLPERSQDSHCQ